MRSNFKVEMLSITFCFINTCLLLFVKYVDTESFYDQPMKIERGNWIINATLMDSISGKIYKMTEFISSGEQTRGRISIKSGTDSVDVFYNNQVNNQRLVMQENDCDLFRYGNDWDKHIENVKEPLVNQVLLTGPSLIFRLQNEYFLINRTANVEVRGYQMRIVKTTISKVNIIYYYKYYYEHAVGLINPTQIVLQSFDPVQHSKLQYELILEYFTIFKSKETFDKMVTPTPGIGCPTYLAQGSHKTKPYFGNQEIKYIETVAIDGPVSALSRNEMLFSEKLAIANLKSMSDGKTTEYIYDYKLGVIYTLEDPATCLITPMDLSTPGIDKLTSCSTYKLLKVSGFERYLGQVFFEHRSGFIVDVYEETEFNVTTTTGSYYDKLVTTHYLMPPDPNNMEHNILVGTTINAYNERTSGRYSLIKSTRRDFYDFEAGNNQGFESKFNVGKCFPDPESRRVLAVQFECKDNGCIEFAEKRYQTFSDRVKDVLSIRGVSPSRIRNVDIIFKDKIFAYIELLDFPRVTDAFKMQKMKLAQSTISSSQFQQASSLDECFQMQAKNLKKFEALIFCEESTSSYICGTVSKMNQITEDVKDGTVCEVAFAPLQNIPRYGQELPLDLLVSAYSKRRLNFSIYDGNYGYISYTSLNVLEVENADETSNRQFFLESQGARLPTSRPDVQLTPNIGNMGDCIKDCAEDDKCEMFSFCQDTNKVACYKSSLYYESTSPFLEKDDKCDLTGKNRIENYVKISNRKFINPISSPTDDWLTKCAHKCYTSDECNSFQHCGQTCTLSGYYTDSSSQLSLGCDIYIPKVAHKFKVTGKKIINQVFHTEYNLTMDQCAALCFDWSVDGEKCRSFNYCPKSSAASSCDLTEYSINNESIVVSNSDICKNYEYNIREGTRIKDQNSNEENVDKRKTSVSLTVGIIVTFFITGLMVGFIVPHGIKKFGNHPNRQSEIPRTFLWSKQEGISNER